MGTMNQVNEIDLYERIIAKDPSAIVEWQDATKPKVMRYVVQTIGLSPEDAEDVWNDAMYETLIKAPALEPGEASLRRWVFRVARNKAIDLRRRAPEEAVSFEDGHVEEPMVRSTVTPDARRIAALRQCLETLAERYRVALEMKTAGAEASEIAMVLGIAETSVYKVIQRMRASMQTCITGRLGA